MIVRVRQTAPLACAAALLWAPPAQGAALKRGDRGQRVEHVQSRLGLPIDGVFGPGTARKVRSFQRAHGLRADGVVGAGTLRMIRRVRQARERARSRTSARGPARGAGRARVISRGSSVRLVQRRLRITADGVYGPGTARAVRALQRRRGMTADGIVGPATWKALGVRGSRPVLKRRGGRSAPTGPRRSGPPVRVVRAIAAANRIARTPYRFGGGHRSFVDDSYDCSGSVSFVLRAASALGRPRTSGGLMGFGSPGRGRWITVYANPGHAFMVIDGRRYDTTGRAQTGTRWQPSMRSTAGYVARHIPGL